MALDRTAWGIGTLVCWCSWGLETLMSSRMGLASSVPWLGGRLRKKLLCPWLSAFSWYQREICGCNCSNVFSCVPWESLVLQKWFMYYVELRRWFSGYSVCYARMRTWVEISCTHITLGLRGRRPQELMPACNLGSMREQWSRKQ